MKYFVPISPDPALKKRKGDGALARFGHLNILVDKFNQLATNQTINASTTNTQAAGTPLIFGYNFVNTSFMVTNTAATLLSLQDFCACNDKCGIIGSVVVQNTGVENLVIYPYLGETINGAGVNVPFTLEAGASVSFRSIDCSSWQSYSDTTQVCIDDVTITRNVDGCLQVANPIPTGFGAYAEYVQRTQAPNNSIPPGRAISYLVDNPTGIFNTIGITTAAGPGPQGTAFNLPVGVYMIDFENSADAASSFAIYQGSSNTVLTVNNDTIAGASTATSWIHGRAIIRSTTGNTWMMVSPVTGTAAIPTAGTAAGQYIARITFLKIA